MADPVPPVEVPKPVAAPAPDPVQTPAPPALTIAELLDQQKDLRPSLRAGFVARLGAQKMKLTDRMTADDFAKTLAAALYGRV